MMLCMLVGAAKADFVQKWTSNPVGPWSSEEATENIPDDLKDCTYSSGTTHKAPHFGTTEIVHGGGNIKVTFNYTSGDHQLVMLGVDVLNANGEVVKSDYHTGKAGGHHENHVYNLNDVAKGEYTLRYIVCHLAGNHELNNTNGNIKVEGRVRQKNVVTTTPLTDVNELSNEKVYVLTPKGTNMWLDGGNDANRGKLYATAGASYLTTTTNMSDYDVNAQFGIVKYNEVYYLYSVAAKKFVHDVDDRYAPLTEVTKSNVTVEKAEEGYFTLKLNGTEMINASTGWQHGAVLNWNEKDNGNVYEIAAVDGVTLSQDDINAALAKREIIYNYKEGDVLRKSETFVVNEGADFPEINIPYVTASKPQGNVSVNGSHDIACTVSGMPFTISDDYENAVWHVLKVNNGTKYVIAGETHPYNNSSSLPTNNYGVWAFVGDVFNGFKIYNKMVGADKTLGSDNTNDGTAAYLKTNETLWIVQPNKSAVNGFDLSRGGDACLNDYHGQLKYWHAAGSPGSSGSCFVAVSLEDVVTEDAVASMKNNLLEGLGTGYVGTLLDSAADELETCDSFEDILDLQSSDAYITLVPGYYFIKGTGNGNNASWYITYGTNNTDFQASSLAEGQKLGAKHVWSFDPIEGEDGYKLKSCNLGKYAQTAAAPTTSQVTSDINNGYKFTFTNQGNGKFIIKDENNNVLRTENGGQLNYWGTENNETWYLIPATELEVDITPAGYATLHLPFGVELPNEGLTAYAVSTVDMETGATEGKANLVEKPSVPANEGVILKGAQGTYTLTIADVEAWNADDNLLAGSNVNTYVEGHAYVLGVNGGVGLFKAQLNKDENGGEGSTHFLNNANKAYLPATSGASLALRFNFGGNTTAIESVLNNGVDANAPIYDLSGRRVNNAVKGGIYIQNGKKFIVK